MPHVSISDVRLCLDYVNIDWLSPIHIIVYTLYIYSFTELVFLPHYVSFLFLNYKQQPTICLDSCCIWVVSQFKLTEWCILPSHLPSCFLARVRSFYRLFSIIRFSYSFHPSRECRLPITIPPFSGRTSLWLFSFWIIYHNCCSTSKCIHFHSHFVSSRIITRLQLSLWSNLFIP